jgi:uncharacterized protein YuzE
MAKIMKHQKAKQLIHYDPESDVFYLGIRKGQEEEYVEVASGINAELDERGQIIGIEILNASKVFKPAVKALSRKSLELARVS